MNEKYRLSLTIALAFFTVHSEDGSRLGCGLLARVPDSELLSTETKPLTDADVTGDGTVIKLGSGDKVCFFGSADNLEPDLLSFFEQGDDCSATNGCGVHIHAGVSCENTTTQEGHFYNKDTLTSDPWQFTGYVETDTSGSAYYTGCLETGETEYDGRAFLVHANDGSRVSCGLLQGAVAPSPTPPSFSAAKRIVLTITTAMSLITALVAGLY